MCPFLKAPYGYSDFFFFCLFKNIYTHSFRFLHQVVNVHGLQSGCLPRPSSNLLLLVSAWGIRKLN